MTNSQFFRGCSLVDFCTVLSYEIWIVGALRTSGAYWKLFIFRIFRGWRFLLPKEVVGVALFGCTGSSFLFFAVLGPGQICLNGFQGRPIRGRQGGAETNHTRHSALKPVQTLTTALQPAASGPMFAEKRQTWTDDC